MSARLYKVLDTGAGKCIVLSREVQEALELEAGDYVKWVIIDGAVQLVKVEV